MIKDYARIALPLSNLTKNEVDWKWTDKEQAAFEHLRNCLTSDSIMSYPNFLKPYWVKLDASGLYVGYVLTQMLEGKERVIATAPKN